MQHPDEGTIHSWLDNELSAEQAALVESHVAGCAQCASAVAEARGFIAASSRILTALDDVPRGVVPAAAARKRDFRVLWRAAAAVLVVAGGSLIVLREGGQEMRSSAAISDSALESTTLSTPTAAAAKAETDAASPSEPRASGNRAISAKRAPQVMSGSARDGAAQPALMDPVAPARAPTNEVQLSGIVAGVQSGVAPLKELSLKRALGTRTIVYQVSPTDTVTLTEMESLSLQGVVATGAASGLDRQQKAAETRAVAPMRGESAPAAAPPPPPPPVAARADSGRADAAAVGASSNTARNTIRWVESATGTTLVLSGNLPVEKLQEIRQRIETERAAARNKNP